MDDLADEYATPTCGGGSPEEKATKEWSKISIAAEKKVFFSKFRKFGVCWNCVHMFYKETKYGKETCVCRNYDRPDTLLDASDPMVECSQHVDKFAMSLGMMLGMAKMIDVDPPKQAGFVLLEVKK